MPEKKMLSKIHKTKRIPENVYMVDYENVQSHGLDGITDLNDSDLVCIFYSDHADSLSFDLLKNLNECRAQIEYQKVQSGSKNALDFQLSAYLGYLISQNCPLGKTKYVIISNDNGFGCLESFWSTRGVKVELSKSVAAAIGLVKPIEIGESLRSLNMSDEEAIIVAECLQDPGTKEELHNELQCRLHDTMRASEIYKTLRPILESR